MSNFLGMSDMMVGSFYYHWRTESSIQVSVRRTKRVLEWVIPPTYRPGSQWESASHVMGLSGFDPGLFFSPTGRAGDATFRGGVNGCKRILMGCIGFATSGRIR